MQTVLSWLSGNMNAACTVVCVPGCCFRSVDTCMCSICTGYIFVS